MIGELVRLKSGHESKFYTGHIGVITSIEKYDLSVLLKNTTLIWERDNRDIFKIWFGSLGRFLHLCQEDFELVLDR
tara:strand:- start:920 stop:1147 length:228 start_codon:yes stop_codon:yes gene_type:complete